MTTFGRYRLDRVLGRGGMGVVHAARDTVLGRDVALKIVAPHLAHDEEFRARFQHEAAVLARLDSDRIVQIFDHGEHEGSLFIVTQLVDGGDLQGLVAREGALAPALAVDVVVQVLEGLRDAHAVGVVHRDIKPANVLLRQRQGEVEAFLCDFGIATTAGAGFTMTGGVAGSLPYMAPERHKGEDATPTSDVYAVGCLLWHALVGSAPYVGTDVEVAMAHIEGPVPQLPGRDDFSKRVNAVLAKALSKDPRKRYASAKAMLADLRPLAEKAPGAIQLPGATAIRRSVVRRRRWVAPVAAAVSVVAVVSGVVAVAALTDRQGSSADADVPLPPGVTETLRIREAQLGPQTTLSPARKRATAPGPAVAPVEPGAAAVEPAPGGTTPSSAPSVRPSSKAAPAPAPAPARARYRCWDGSTVYDEATRCGIPTGRTGMLWMFPADAFRSCTSPADFSGNEREGWVCHLTAPSGNRVGVSLIRWPTSEEGWKHHDRWFADGTTWQRWYVGGELAGLRKVGPGRNGGVGDAFHYTKGPWSLGASAPTQADLDWLLGRVGRFRLPSQAYGVRIG